jgi:hypothetical protein
MELKLSTNLEEGRMIRSRDAFLLHANMLLDKNVQPGDLFISFEETKFFAFGITGAEYKLGDFRPREEKDGSLTYVFGVNSVDKNFDAHPMTKKNMQIIGSISSIKTGQVYADDALTIEITKA